ncbi:hypothetical protein JKF63_01971 [Porcisia hertigi]|uniref:Uncharacterized protein n=1 Tax=Porcisia hertigi TaxID=2761500 RepID=A0A836L0K4_9TRYP|nr:hypothetical protein JKF63_01971 [Porcisia hertigi]
MWYVRRELGSCLRRWAKPVLTPSAATPFLSSSTSALQGTSAVIVSPIRLSNTCHLLHSICNEQQPETVRRRRIRGVIHKMESSIVESFTASTASLTTPQRHDFMRRWLRSLAAVVKYLPRQEASLCAPGGVEAGRFSPRSSRRARHDKDESETWSGASPYFSLVTGDLLCLCLRECAMNDPRAEPAVWRELLLCAVRLELGEVDVLQHIIHLLTNTDVCRHQTCSEQVELLNNVSLAVKRCKIPLPRLDRLLCGLPAATLSPRENLLILSALHRLQHTHAADVVASVSRRAAKQTDEYNIKDVIYALEVAALLPGCNEVFVAGVLTRASALAPDMSPKQLGAVCKYVGLLNPSRRQNTLAHSCGRELRALLPLLVEGAERLLGQFRLREARYVLRCFREHKVRHSLIFSRLTAIMEGD